jgi:DNA-binding transcriptional ArsR family regulator
VEDATPIPKESQAPVKPRGLPRDEAPFDWIARSVRERILKRLGNTQSCFGLGVYFALLEKCNQDEQWTNPVRAKINEIAGLARLSYPKTAWTLDALKEAGVIDITKFPRKQGCGRDQEPSVYTVLSLRHNTVTSHRHNTVTSERRNKCGTALASVIRTETIGKEQKEQIEGKAPSQIGAGLEERIFPGSGKEMIRLIEAEIRAIKSDRHNWEFALAKETLKTIAWLRDEANSPDRPDNWETQAKAMESNPENLVKSKLQPDVQSKVSQLSERIAEIKRRMT